MRRAAATCAAFTVIAGAGCNRSLPDGSAPASYLRLADAEDVPTLDPAHGYDTRSWQFEEMIFDTLVDYDDRGRIVGELAESWALSADGRTYTFQLKQGSRFSNGRAVTAADVRFSIERVVDPRTKSLGAEFFRTIAGADACTGRGRCRIEGIRVPEPHRVVFSLSAVDPIFLHKLTLPFAGVIPGEEAEQWGEDFGRHAVGSGPFVLEEWLPGQRIRLRRNRDRPPHERALLEGIELRMGLSDEVAWMQFDSGNLDVLEVQPAEVPRLKRSPRAESRLHEITTMRTSYVGLKCGTPPLADVRVRRAINHAVNKEKVVRLLRETATPARGVLPPNMPGHDPHNAGYAFDPDAARRLLTESGYPAGFEATLWVRSDPTALHVAQGLQQDLAAVGIRIAIKPVAWGALLEAVRADERVQMFLLGWEADFPDPSNFLEVLFHSRSIGSNNNTDYANPAVDRLLDEAARLVDPSLRLDKLQAAERLIVADAPWVFLYHPVTYYGIDERVRGFTPHPFRPPRYDKVRVEDPPAE